VNIKTGPAAAFGAYIVWGLLPIFWKQLAAIPAIETLCHRAVWAAILLLLILMAGGRRDWLRIISTEKKAALAFVLTASLLGINWFTYIWAVNHNYLVEASLGYFINPLINVLLGVLLLHERLRSLQWLAIILAASGVGYMTINYGRFPWIALTLAVTFAIYGLLHKTTVLKALDGLLAEMLVMSVPAATFLFYLQYNRTASFTGSGIGITVMLCATGIATAIPLLLFSYGAKSVNLSTLGILQYIAPTLQFLLGVLIYNEDFSGARMVGFVIIWVALLFYSIDSIFWFRKQNMNPRTTPEGAAI
jgi:chloramphenicol-sensitive protein RarD